MKTPIRLSPNLALPAAAVTSLLRTLELITGRGEIRASEELFS